MSDEALELGCKISLVSKAGIRYEGCLFTVDPEQCTIALSGVRSFGTEDRDVPQKVPPQSNVYDYILFRGSDIRDIVILSNLPSYPHHDPAIMQLSVPPSLNQKQFQQQPFGQPMMGHMGQHMNQFPSSSYGGMAPMGNMPSCLAPGMNAMGRDSRGFPKPSELTMPGPVPPPPSPAVEPQRPNEHDILAARSRSTTPASLISGKSSTNDQGVQVSGPNKRDDKKVVQPIQPPGARNQQQRDRRDTRDGQNQQRNQVRPGRYMGNQQNNSNQRQGGWVQRGQVRQQRGRARTGVYKQQPGVQTNQAGSEPKIKFDQEYDFQQANKEFIELLGQLEKTKLDDGKPEVNGDVDKKDDSGNETGAGEGEPEEEVEVYYDKSKSFFDNISCESVERSKGRSQRTDWRTERKLNTETFGVSSTRRGGYRGRGAYRGMGYRGGYRGYQNRGQRRDQSNRAGDAHPQQGEQSISSNANKAAPSAVPANTLVGAEK